MKVYLAGAFCPYSKSRRFKDWRDFVKQKTRNKRIEFYDPRYSSEQLCPATFTIDDAKGVLRANILFHYRTRGYEDEGASWEHGIAFAANLINQKIRDIFPEFPHNPEQLIILPRDKLIIYVDDTSAPWPLNFASANVNFSNLEAAVEFLSKLKSLNKESWTPVYTGLINRDRSN